MTYQSVNPATRKLHRTFETPRSRSRTIPILAWVAQSSPRISRGERVASRLETGMVFINNLSWSDVELSFGGIKNSGYGRELGSMGIQEFVNKKLVRYVAAGAPE